MNMQLGAGKCFMAYKHFVCQYFYFFFRYFALACAAVALVVISVYCFLYIFLLERTKSHSTASQPFNPPSFRTGSSHISSSMPAFVCFMSLFCALPGGAEYYYFLPYSSSPSSAFFTE